MKTARTTFAVVLFLCVSFSAPAQVADGDANARRLGVEAAQAASSDPSNAEAIIAGRYREALTLAADEAARARVRAEFQRGYQETLAAQATGTAPTAAAVPVQAPAAPAVPPAPPPAAPPSPPPPAPVATPSLPKPVQDLFEGLGRILRGR